MAAGDERLSADDAAILALETDAIAGHTLKLIVLERGERPLDLAQLRAGVERRLADAPRGRQRVEAADGREPARWVEDERFEIAAHVRGGELAGGADEAALWDAAGSLMATRLDHDRPLWALELLGPLADGRVALVARIHHAMADGIACMRFLGAVLWEPAPDATPPPRGGPRPRPRRAAPAAEIVRLPGAVGRELVARAPHTALDRTIGSARELAFLDADLEELRRIGASRPGHVTVNDVLLAGVAGGLAAWLDAPRLRAQVPVSLHHRDSDGASLGNRDSFLNVDLPLAEVDPLARLDAINAETAKRKRLGDAEELYDLFHALARFRHLGGAVGRLAAGPGEFSLSISNVPGPPGEVTVCGRRVERLYSVAEPADHHALRVAALSCAGRLGVGLCTDPEALGGVRRLGEAIERSLAELRVAAIQ